MVVLGQNTAARPRDMAVRRREGNILHSGIPVNRRDMVVRRSRSVAHHRSNTAVPRSRNVLPPRSNMAARRNRSMAGLRNMERRRSMAAEAVGMRVDMKAGTTSISDVLVAL